MEKKLKEMDKIFLAGNKKEIWQYKEDYGE